ncbi:MAG: hypothetical protein HXY48_11130 [Ignavibacteriaceae bacterium]|jgi:hypothetical protein|nr:hypothetical protein [Ignavibacteriaceae bacterium]
MNIIFLTLFAFIINIPFGYWRSNVRKYSLQFFLAIHVPVALIILFRLLTGKGFEVETLFFTVPAFFFGQFAGSKIYSFRKHREAVPLTSCLVMDLVRVKNSPKD